MIIKIALDWVVETWARLNERTNHQIIIITSTVIILHLKAKFHHKYAKKREKKFRPYFVFHLNIFFHDPVCKWEDSHRDRAIYFECVCVWLYRSQKEHGTPKSFANFRTDIYNDGKLRMIVGQWVFAGDSYSMLCTVCMIFSLVTLIQRACAAFSHLKGKSANLMKNTPQTTAHARTHTHTHK